MRECVIQMDTNNWSKVNCRDALIACVEAENDLEKNDSNRLIEESIQIE